MNTPPVATLPQPASAARPWLLMGAALVLLASTYLLAYHTPRHHTAQLFSLLSVGVAAYAGLLRGRLSLRAGLLLALALRLLWLPALPALSDDYHRFRWDGLLVAAGQNPFQHRPDEYTAGGGQLTGPATLSPTLFARLNSPHYYSVYPPVCQLAFGTAARLFPHSERGFVLLLRLLILAAEGGTALLLCWLLRRWQLPAERALWYLLHPMVVVELVGNLHFEALVVCGVLLMLALLVRQRLALAAGALGLAVAAKLTPLLLLPLLPRRLGLRLAVGVAAGAGLTLALLFAPFVSLDLLRNFSRSLDLYFHSFEFNASLYYLLRAIGFWLTGYNQIARLGTVLAGVAVAGILALAAREAHPTLRTLPRSLLLVFTLYYALATTVHPWYLMPLLALNCFVGWRYPLVWATLAALSYATYRTTTYQENLWLVALEYGAVLLAAWVDWREEVTGDR